ncbi:MAG TPA: hypothetical protein VFT51_04190 [Bacillales bacterium]|nr:hypothetical protein [Bacillales bacterium]
MKKAFTLVLTFMFLMSMAGCGNGADFQGIIHEVKESSIIVGTDDVDPEASYPVYEVFVDNQTKIKGAVNEFSKLKADQKVEIWVIGDWNNIASDEKVASKMIVSQNEK